MQESSHYQYQGKMLLISTVLGIYWQMCVSVYEEGDKKGDRGSGGGEGGGGGGGGKGSGIIVTHTVHIQCVKTAANILRQASKLHKLQVEGWGHKLKTRSIQNAN